MDVDLRLGDSLELLATLEAGSIDAVVTDPPYELGFMGKAWDSSGIAYSVDLWRAVLRVLKPGGHLLAFGGTRTSHRMTCAIEDAGFEIRDSLQWLYGTGFPKSLDVSKAIDKGWGDDVRPVCRYLRAAMTAAGMSTATVDAAFGLNGMAGHWSASDSNTQPACPTDAQWAQLHDLLGDSLGDAVDAEVARLNARRGEFGEDYQRREITGSHKSQQGMVGKPFVGIDNLRRDIAATEDAARWQGWGTALKPAVEPITLARKPLVGTVAANVLAHGTGAINVDGCRIGSDDDTRRNSAGGDNGMIGTATFRIRERRADDQTAPSGRWPANVLLDEAAAAMLDAQSDGASRFFYVSKPSSAERDFGLDDLPVIDSAALVERVADSAGMASPRAGAGRTSGRRNFHATVKPIDLMRYLCRLITPPGGVVLDPFAGSGTTGIAAVVEGFGVVAFELDPEHAILADRRIHAAAAGGLRVDTATDTVQIVEATTDDQRTLFDD